MLHVELHTVCKTTHCVSNYTLCVKLHTAKLHMSTWVPFVGTSCINCQKIPLTWKNFPPSSSFKFLTFISWNIPWWDHFKCPTLWAQIEADPVYELKTWYFVTISMMRTNSATLYKGECKDTRNCLEKVKKISHFN